MSLVPTILKGFQTEFPHLEISELVQGKSDWSIRVGSMKFTASTIKGLVGQIQKH